MATSQSNVMSRTSREDADAVAPQRFGLSELLRLFGAGVTGSIVLALRDGPLRTKDLTARVPGYGPRTVYRYVDKLVAIGAVEREEQPGVPSKVVYRLAQPCGVELCELTDRFSRTWLEVLPNGGIVPHSWGSLTLLGDLWESGMFKELNISPRTATELARGDHDLSFHQVSRRTNLLMNAGLLREADDERRRRRYELTEEARRLTSLIVGLGNWRGRYLVGPEDQGLTAGETADLLRAALPLVVLPDHAGKSFRFSVGDAASDTGDEVEVVWATVEPCGRATSCTHSVADADGWGRGGVCDWARVLLEGITTRVGGDRSAIESCLLAMHAALWGRAAPTAAARAR